MGKKNQLFLFEWTNPLNASMGAEFFAGLPAQPGVYQFRAADDSVLYVGQSACLRDRLRSYRYIHPETHSRRLVRLVSRVASIRYTVCENPLEARLLENRLIGELKPPFNRQNVYPEGYCYLQVEVLSAVPGMCCGADLVLRIVDRPSENGAVLTLGAFKSRRVLARMLQTFRRLVHAQLGEGGPRGVYPRFGRRDMDGTGPGQRLWCLSLPADHDPASLPEAISFLTGHSCALVASIDHRWNLGLTQFIEAGLAAESNDSTDAAPGWKPVDFWHAAILEDMTVLIDFFERVLRKTRLAASAMAPPASHIPAAQLNDWLTIAAARSPAAE